MVFVVCVCARRKKQEGEGASALLAAGKARKERRKEGRKEGRRRVPLKLHVSRRSEQQPPYGVGSFPRALFMRVFVHWFIGLVLRVGGCWSCGSRLVRFDSGSVTGSQLSDCFLRRFLSVCVCCSRGAAVSARRGIVRLRLSLLGRGIGFFFVRGVRTRRRRPIRAPLYHPSSVRPPPGGKTCMSRRDGGGSRRARLAGWPLVILQVYPANYVGRAPPSIFLLRTPGSKHFGRCCPMYRTVRRVYPFFGRLSYRERNFSKR